MVSAIFQSSISSLAEAIPLGKLQLFGLILIVALAATLIAVLLDLRDGVATARRCGQAIRSNKLRVTVTKIIEYWQFVFLGFLADVIAGFAEFYWLPFVAIIFSIGVIILEGKSMFEHARRRKSGVAKLPSTVADILEAIGGIDELHSILVESARRNAEWAKDKPTAEPPVSDTTI